MSRLFHIKSILNRQGRKSKVPYYYYGEIVEVSDDKETRQQRPIICGGGGLIFCAESDRNNGRKKIFTVSVRSHVRKIQEHKKEYTIQATDEQREKINVILGQSKK